MPQECTDGFIMTAGGSVGDTEVVRDVGRDSDEAFEELDSIIGNARAVGILKTAILAAKAESRMPGHILLHGPSGTGKTKLAKIVANCFDSKFHRIHAPGITKNNIQEFMVALLAMGDGETLFVDEIHALPKEAMENLYEAMEEGHVSILSKTPDGVSRAITVKISNIMIVAATTDPNKLSEPFKMRFSRRVPVFSYSVDELTLILEQYSKTEFQDISSTPLSFTPDVFKSIAEKSRGRARIALQYFGVVRDHMIVYNQTGDDACVSAFREMGVGENGDTQQDRDYVMALYRAMTRSPNKAGENTGDGILGLKSLQVLTGLSVDDIEKSIEPFLISLHCFHKTRKGRSLDINNAVVKRIIRDCQNEE